MQATLIYAKIKKKSHTFRSVENAIATDVREKIEKGASMQLTIDTKN
jgi:hypothetical protein